MEIDYTNEVMMNHYKKQELIKAKKRLEEKMSKAEILRLANKRFITEDEIKEALGFDYIEDPKPPIKEQENIVDEVDYVIPANDDAIRAVKLITAAMADAICEAKGEPTTVAYAKDEYGDKEVTMNDAVASVEESRNRGPRYKNNYRNRNNGKNFKNNNNKNA